MRILNGTNPNDGTGDGIPLAAKPGFLDLSIANKFRTPPLWGLRLRATLLMHDDDTPSPDAGIKRHAGEATKIRERYKQLSPEQKTATPHFPGYYDVDDFASVGAPKINNDHSSAEVHCQLVHNKDLESTRFSKAQQAIESGSGPGGRRFKSSLPDQFFL
jgi:hypothetical protein